MVKIENLYDLTHTRAAAYLQQFSYPWEALGEIEAEILALGAGLPETEFIRVKESVWVHKTAEIAPTAYLGAPCIIDAHTQVRHGAFIRGAALVGCGCVVGNSVELKNVILFDGVQVPHYNYVGDSILGYKAHLGAGSLTSNVKSDKSLVTIRTQPPMETGRKKVGAMVGDFGEIGCNSVLNPGTVIGRNATVYPGVSVRGVVPENCIFKNQENIVKKENL